MAEYKIIRTNEYRFTKSDVPKNIGTLECWNIGTLEFLNFRTLEYWNGKTNVCMCNFMFVGTKI